MGWFWEPKVPDTISDAEMASLSRRAQRASRESTLSKRAVERRKADAEQREKREQS